MTQPELGPQVQLQIAALVFPIIALVVSFAIDSVEKDESLSYRAAIGALGTAAIIPALILVFTTVFGSVLGFTPDSILLYLILSFSFTTVLVTLVLLHEVLKGVEDEEDSLLVLVVIGISLVILVVILQWVG